MDIPRFGLGVRFDFLSEPVTKAGVRYILNELSSLLCAKDVSDLDIYGGVFGLSPLDGDSVYTVVFTNGGIKKTKALYHKIDNDAALNRMLCARSPYLQHNVLRSFEELEYFGRVAEDGTLSGGSEKNLRFPAKAQKRPTVDSCRRIVIAPNSFKGTFSALEAAEIIAHEMRDELPLAKCVLLPIADGGDGTLDAVENMVLGRKRSVNVTAPYGDKIPAEYLVIDGQKAVIESALASGLALCDSEQLDPMRASSRGTGELIMRALREGASEVLVGLGGSATNDCGIGAACAMGFGFLDADGNEIDSAERMIEVRRIDSSGVEPLVKNAKFTLMCDVSNPLCGINGATYTYGPQKGADAETLDLLEKGMLNIAQLLDSYAGKPISETSGAGAAGGMGAMFMALLGARYVSGADAVLDLASFEKACKDSLFVITGEGCVDETSMSGKAVGTVLKRSECCGIPAAIIAGCRGNGAELAEAKACYACYCGDEEDRREALKKSARMLAKRIGAEYLK